MSSSNPSGPGGVRNLRAIFENKSTSEHSTSPPSRGRSPLEAESTDNNRPLSKVRASFIAVEKPGDLGQAPLWSLRKASDVSSATGFKVNGISKMEVPSQDLGMVMKGHPFVPSTTAHAQTPKEIANTASPSKIPSKVFPNSKAFPNLKANGETSIAKGPASNITKLKSPVSPNVSKTSTAQPSATKPAQSVKPPQMKQNGSKPSEKSPVLSNSPKFPATAPPPHIRGIRGGPGKIMSVTESANRAAENRATAAAASEKASSAPHPKPNQTAKRDSLPKQPATNVAKKEPSTPPKIKAVPKSPTKTTRLPAAATAPTVASVARTETAAPPTTATAGRRTSSMKRDPAPPKVANNTTASSLAKRTPRASLQPETNGQHKEAPKPRASIAHDEGFLARMMRPTASSQQKTHDKMPKSDSPPTATRKVSDRASKSSGSEKEKNNNNNNNNKENEADSPVELTKKASEELPIPADEKVYTQADTSVAQDAA